MAEVAPEPIVIPEPEPTPEPEPEPEQVQDAESSDDELEIPQRPSSAPSSPSNKPIASNEYSSRFDHLQKIMEEHNMNVYMSSMKKNTGKFVISIDAESNKMRGRAL